ncbi:MAG: tetratricopeptide repeat protein, partial [Thermoplasmata archaeon]|nr:tetratricopeptide repeat protein [Thermoplasmata archaeon]
LTLSKEMNDAEGIADSLRGLGYLHWRRGNLTGAIKHYDQGLAAIENRPAGKIQALIYTDMGSIYSETGEYDKTIEYFDKSLKILESVGDIY